MMRKKRKSTQVLTCSNCLSECPVVGDSMPQTWPEPAFEACNMPGSCCCGAADEEADRVQTAAAAEAAPKPVLPVEKMLSKKVSWGLPAARMSCPVCPQVRCVLLPY